MVLIQSSESEGFADWLNGFRARARDRGITAETLDAALDGISYQPEIIDRDRNQAEFVRPIWEYLDTAVSANRVTEGRAAMAAQADLLAALEQRYGVDRDVVVAIWGLESHFGTFRGETPIIPALASLSFDSRRGAFFEGQLLAALRILQNGDTSPANMTGSWAGAMGHTQFMPTSFLAYAVDYDGDGRRDIWADDPTDALASTAAYLARFGWIPGQPWGVEVTLPEGFDYRLADRSVERLPGQWAEIGVMGMDGAPVPDHGEASILLPAGAEGAAFMIFDNYAVIERYNAADAYVIAVGHLSDRLTGGDPFVAEWPRDSRALTNEERFELQERLTGAGFSTRGVDGKIGPNTIGAIRAYQQAVGLTPDGYPSTALLDRLREG
ncbi:lytic murein transglycosylase [Pelagovum pacificum]|uniref:Lytic murein transglycosylase n=1 Tax=Pelagovum pacificum TaxID=2588711 RepID=A0A5C5GHE9_9RHOB|nr:lytic murein transglycosylase [Pelagovum pacificum]QQA42641.1 lytic murein transglycosylase [Pelagovum pacificum]TNY34208.1 lytic murein transglycosylase [Pelagovum pacificum]